MNKLAKRVLAFMLVVCLLTALVPAVVSAETADPYVIDFEIDTNANLTWKPFEDKDAYTFAGTNFAHAQTDNGHAVWLEAFSAYYADGTIDFSFPHTVITAADAEADESLTDSVGKIADAGTYKSHFKNTNQFGSYKYNDTGAALDWTGLKIGAASGTYNTSGTGWNAMILRAPDAGKYTVSMEYTMYGAASNGTKVFLLPYTAEMKAKVADDAAGWHADIEALVAEGDAADAYMGKFSSWIKSGSTPEPGKVADLGEISVGVETDEYLLVLAETAGKYAYLQNITFTPVAEEEIPAEVIERNYSIAGTVSSNTVLNKDGVTESVEALYTAGTIDWSYLGTNSDDSEVQLQKGYIYNQNVYKDTSGVGNYEQHYEAYKVRSPGEGVYDISVSVYKPTDVKTMAWCSIYMDEYTEGMDPESIVTDANKIGECHPANNEGVTGAHTYDVGDYTFAGVDKVYIIVLKADLNDNDLKPNTDYSALEDGDELKKNVNMTNNFYMRAFVMEPQVEAPSFVPKAYIGTTPYATVTAAAAAAKSGETVKLAVDYTGNIDLPAGVTLDLAGHTWSVTTVTTTNANEAIIDSVGTGSLVAKNIDLYGSNANVLPLAKGNNAYALAEYDMTVVENDYEVVGEATRFWFKLDLEDAYLDMIAAGNTGLTIGVELDWGAAETLAVTFDNGNGAEAFAAEWAAAAKAGTNVWLYVDITGVDALAHNLTVTPLLQVGDTALSAGHLTYEIG